MATKTAHLKLDPDARVALGDIADDLAALRTSVDNLRTTVNAVITAAATSLPTVAAVTAAAAAPTLNTSKS